MKRDGPIPLWTDDADLAVEASHLASVLGMRLSPQIDPRPLERAARSSGTTVVALSEAPPATAMIEAVLAAQDAGGAEPVKLVLGLSCAPTPARDHAIAVATELGVPAVTDLRPLLTAALLTDARATKPSVRSLPPADRRRIDAPGGTERAHGRLVRLDTLHLGWLGGWLGGNEEREPDASDAVVLGEARDVGEALAALRAAQEGAPRSRAVIDGVDHAAVDEVLFGPPRALSDPASKAVLERYGLPMPVEELCSSPSRAAAEAARIGFPVRVSLASPDLRLWDHPDLAIDGVASAAGVRDAFRQITALATERRGEARLLGVHVTAATVADALLSLRAVPGASGLSIGQLGFADAHGMAAGDETPILLPTTPERLERAVGRLRGKELLLGGGPARRRTTLESLADLLVRVAAFLDRSPAVTQVELRPVAILPTGRCEVREACVTVGDTYQRRLDEGARSA